jgi:RNA polymerase sigma-70 factor (ECF subfamily)
MNYSALSPEELIWACAQSGEAHAWEEFIRRFNPLIARVALRTARRWERCSIQLVDDLVQEIYLKLCAEDCRLLRSFESRQPEAIYGYLKVVTVNLVHDHFKTLYAAKRGAGEPSAEMNHDDAGAERGGNRQLSSQDSIERIVLLREIDRHLANCVPAEDLPRSRLIFWLYYRCGLSARAIASLPNVGLSTKGVESALLRLTRLVRSELSKSPSKQPASEGEPDQKQKGFRPAESF